MGAIRARGDFFTLKQTEENLRTGCLLLIRRSRSGLVLSERREKKSSGKSERACCWWDKVTLSYYSGVTVTEYLDTLQSVLECREGKENVLKFQNKDLETTSHSILAGQSNFCKEPITKAKLQGVIWVSRKQGKYRWKEGAIGRGLLSPIAVFLRSAV